MRKIKFIAALTMIAGSLIFSGCSDDETVPSNTNGVKDRDAILSKSPQRNVTDISSHVKELSSQKGNSKSRISKYISIERWAPNYATLEGQSHLWYSGTQVSDIAWLNTAGFYSGWTRFTYSGGKLQYQDKWTLDSPDGEWRWLGYFYYQYNANNTVQYIIDYNTDGSVFRFLYFTYKVGSTKIDKIYTYDYDWDHLNTVRTVKYNALNRIISITHAPVIGTGGVDSYVYNANGTMASRTLSNNSRRYNYFYGTDMWYTDEYLDGRLVKHFRYYMDVSATGNFEPWDPKNIINLNFIDSFVF